MAKDIYVDIEKFKEGFYALEDTTKAPIGSARIMKNCQITDRGGISNRDGVTLIGTKNTQGFGTKGFYNFKKSFGTNEYLLKAYDDELEVYDSTYGDWFRIKNGFTSDKEFGFINSLVNTDNKDYLVFCNRFDDYSRWLGSITHLTTTLVGSETAVTVTSTLADDTYYSVTATANSATTLTVAGTPWATGQWVGFFVYIPSTGKVRRITANTANQLTFNTLGSAPGNVAFQIKQLAFPLAKITASTIAFNDANPDTITDSGNGFITAGFKAGDRIVITGSSSNNGSFTIATVTAGTITLIGTDSLTAEAAGSSVTIVLEEMAIIYNGTRIAYSDIDTSTTFTVTSAHAGASGLPVSVSPSIYPANPRGNRFANLVGRIVTGNVRSALARDAGGALSGYASAGSYFVSKLNNHVDFGYSAPRVAGEGDVVSTPYGGGDIVDVQTQEDVVYIFKNDYIEAAKYTQDANDLIQREPLKAGIGSSGKTLKASDDIYFFTPDKRFVSIGRIKTKDIKPQTENIGYKIKRYLDNAVFDDVAGVEYKNKLLASFKSSSESTKNDVVLIYNKDSRSFEGIWDIGLYGFASQGNVLYGAEAVTSDVYKLVQNGQKADIIGTTRYRIFSEYASHYMNLTPSKVNLQGVHSLYFEGYIKGGTSLTFNLFKDFSDSASISFTFGGTEEQFLDGQEISAFLGANPLGLSPIGSINRETDLEGRRHFQFRVYFPYQYGNYFSVGWANNESDQDYEITRYGLGIKEDVTLDANRVKSI